jgi:hypothetical protein
MHLRIVGGSYVAPGPAREGRVTTTPGADPSPVIGDTTERRAPMSCATTADPIRVLWVTADAGNSGPHVSWMLRPLASPSHWLSSHGVNHLRFHLRKISWWSQILKREHAKIATPVSMHWMKPATGLLNIVDKLHRRNSMLRQ